jgi:hypothetical protein
VINQVNNNKENTLSATKPAVNDICAMLPAPPSTINSTTAPPGGWMQLNLILSQTVTATPMAAARTMSGTPLTDTNPTSVAKK